MSSHVTKPTLELKVVIILFLYVDFEILFMLKDVQILEIQISTIKFIQGHRTSIGACLELVKLHFDLFYT